ncbi:MAG: A/G-specific adenine glycosylase [Candidatus Binatia bacterium]|nr:A/G-specific adenine glycosylase [Candidatus Binatia bacterium]
MARTSRARWQPAHPATIRAFQRRLITWYHQHGRDLPWRRTRDPYAILVSEMMLQQTQVQRALHYYEKFLKRYPTVEELAGADESQVRETWEGLGYYARVRHLQQATRKIVTEHGGQFPRTYKELTALPGVGPYTAGAVLSFAFRQDAAILDTNAARVLRRFFALPPERQTTRALWDVARQVTPTGQAHVFNQAIMDLGATICVARTPHCPRCPVRRLCRSVVSPSNRQQSKAGKK